ncbi:MAG: hypothetical protein K8R36_15355 [Planctomycetales bacterium]|nr:hypothetical protein [Planctomycetales bacterium]
MLVTVHLVLTASQLVMLYPMLRISSIWMMPMFWGAQMVVIGQLMLLAFWAGLGTNAKAWRMAGTIAGTGYVAFWSSSPLLISLWILPNSSWTAWLRQFGIQFGQGGMLVLILGSVFLIMRRWFAHLVCIADVKVPPETHRYQFSIQHLLVITTLTAIFLASRRGKIEGLDLRLMIITSVLIVVVFMVNGLFAVRVTLRNGPIHGRLFLVFVVAVLLGAGLSLVAGHTQVSWWLAALSALTMTIPTLVVVLSLLVVRSCGYRLVPNPPARNPGVLNVSASPS